MTLIFLKEFEEPTILLEDHNSLFYALVQQTGTATANALTELAKRSYYFDYSLFIPLFYLEVQLFNFFLYFF